jgi:hypothetical protein
MVILQIKQCHNLDFDQNILHNLEYVFHIRIFFQLFQCMVGNLQCDNCDHIHVLTLILEFIFQISEAFLRIVQVALPLFFHKDRIVVHLRRQLKDCIPCYGRIQDKCVNHMIISFHMSLVICVHLIHRFLSLLDNIPYLICVFCSFSSVGISFCIWIL